MRWLRSKSLGMIAECECGVRRGGFLSEIQNVSVRELGRANSLAARKGKKADPEARLRSAS